ncbi:MAG: bifunctional phosphopantothenoylcysteine decarboxylase/phosphopantothenate synthase [Rhodospirillales bacterium RIFCSPLOWO2_12_FULL_67_15]|nr:MAG: bifunctional phosphopantothenoylcysteine decarboxylase/phosphopantothenate synthase [Rhodospirillales bacterium RIFCSPLOWO2_12_FULL_67_15]
MAAYKTPELVRRLRETGLAVRCVLTRAGREFVAPLALAAVSEDKVYDDLFSLTIESEMGHIRLSREADLVVVAPATADILAKLAAGLAGDLASTLLLATDKPVLAAPAMNVRMWEHPATQANLATLRQRGVVFVGPEEGDMACGEWGMGRMAEPETIVEAVAAFLALKTTGPVGALAGTRALVTSGPTWEALDPVRYVANRSSGKQGHAIARALARAGARVTLVTGPVALADPPGIATVHVESAREMLEACERALPADVAVCAAAVADWRAANPARSKIKKTGRPLSLALAENPDILGTLARAGARRPRLVIGFAAETGDLVANARKKLAAKGCDWILANDVSADTGVFGGDVNTVEFVTRAGTESWPALSKDALAARLAARVADALGSGRSAKSRKRSRR